MFPRRTPLPLLLPVALLGCPASLAEPPPGRDTGAIAAAAPQTSVAPGAQTAAAAPAVGAAGEGAAAPLSAAAEAAPSIGRAPGELLLSAVGDCTLGSEYELMRAPGSFVVELAAHHNDYRYPFSGVVDVLSKDDLTIANLETTLSTHKPVKKGRFVFRGEPEYARMLAFGSVELVNVANNHSYDLGFPGFDETVRSVEAVGVGAFGMGRVDRRTVNGVEVINLGYTGGDPDGVIKDMVRAVQSHKRPENLVIVSFHWGGEGVSEANDSQIRLGHAAIDAGADLVLGHHPHVLQGIEDYRGRRIVYSLGNFVFGGHSNPDDKDSIIFQASFARRDGRVIPTGSQALPVRISSVTERNDYRPVLLEGEERARVLARLEDCSAALARRGTEPSR